jgi:hypothetical protein
MTRKPGIPVTSWLELATWRTEGQPWRTVKGSEHHDVATTLVCTCHRASYEHDPSLAGSPVIDPVTGARLCDAFDPVTRLRKVTRWERQDAAPDRIRARP